MDQTAGNDRVRLTVPMVDPEIVRQLRGLAALGWGTKRIARELGIARNSVKRYLRSDDAETQIRPGAWTLDAVQRDVATSLLDGPAEGNSVVVQRLLAEKDVEVPLRTLQRTLAPHRKAKRAAEVATVRFETAPGHQMQIDFGEKWIVIASKRTKVHLFVAVLGYSRRIFVRASLSQRQDDWREGLACAFRTFGGVTQKILIDRAGALVVGEDRESGTARVHPAFAAFCKDWGVGVAACRPYRARTKGKTESGVGYVKKNAIAGLSFVSFAALEIYLENWIVDADRRIHGTTFERPCDRFEQKERSALLPLPSLEMPVRQRSVSRRVSTDCFVDVDTIRYSVPHRLVRCTVEVLVAEHEVVIFEGRIEVARHRRHKEPHECVRNPRHFDGIFRTRDEAEVIASSPIGRSLAEYAECVGGEA